MHFAVLFQPFLGQYQMRTNSPQARWPDADLAASQKPWKVVRAHIPWETTPANRITDLTYNGRRDGARFARVLAPRARVTGVPRYLTGHAYR